MRPSPGALLIALVMPWLSAPAAAEAIALRFDWPDGLEAAVTFEATRERTFGEARQQRSISGNYSMSARRVPDGLLVEIGGMTLDAGGQQDADRGAVQSVLERLGSVLPDHVVGADGKIVRTVGADDLREALRGAIGETLSSQPAAVRTRIERALDAALTTVRLESSVRSYWNRGVGNWVGLSLEPGRPYEGMATASAPLLPGQGVPAKVSYRLTGRRPCTPDEWPARCVALEMATTIDAEGAAAAIETLARNFSARAGRAVRIDELSIETRVSLLTEPDTLLPHEIEFSRVTSLVVTTGEGGPQHRSQQERRTARYTYR